ncbi:MAG: branched chain amino acid aminotransferase [Pelagibacterales bacterium]|nr:branched chain amino acid aminotransferase [Pelagibacterales bacterium]
MDTKNKNSIVWFDGEWSDGSKPIMSSMSQSYMHGSTIFDGARAYNNSIPDLHKHCERLINSSKIFGLSLPISKNNLINLCKEGASFFENNAELYIRPSIFCENGFLIPDAKSSKLVITVFRAPMPSLNGFKAMLSSYRRPHPLMAPTLAKASCLYANTSLALSEAKSNGFDNVVMRDGEENVVEFGSANLFIVKSNRVITPEWNKTFLNGITKQRVISLLKNEGIDVIETKVSTNDLLVADEVFSTGNFGKVLPVRKIDKVEYEIGSVCNRAIQLYQKYASTYKD